MQKQNIIFDLDDTLIHCNKYFLTAIDNFLDNMLNCFHEYDIDKEEIRTKQQEIDIKGVTKNGFAAEHFANSFLETYASFCEKFGKPKNTQEEAALKAIASSAYNQQFEPYPFMRDVLESMKGAGYNLYLYTAGNPIIQRKKVEIVNIAHFFGDRIYVTPHKNAEVLQSIIKKNNLDKEHTWMIGNSMRSDIKPAIEAGIKAVFIPGKFEWAYDNVTLEKHHNEAFITLESLDELKDLFFKKAV